MKLVKHLPTYVLALVLWWCTPVLALDFNGFKADEVSLWVQNMDSEQVLLSHRADVAMSPASTIKLLTAWYALRRLGADYRVDTYWHSSAAIKQGVLQGDLVWRGSGDPTFDHVAMQQMLQQLRQHGITQIQGRLILDKSRWDNIPSADDFEHDSEAAFTVPPDTHMLDYHVVWLARQINELDGLKRWTMSPPLAGISIDDTLLQWRSQGPCLHRRSIQTQWQEQVIRLRGNANPACDAERFYSKGLSSDEYVYRAFKAAWNAMGGRGADEYLVAHTPPPTGRILAKHQSPPLAQVIEYMNKFSNNVIARSLVMLADHSSRVDGQRALQQLRDEVRQAGMADGALVLENGSGLSRNERVSARLMGQILNQAYHSANKEVFWNSLPIAGVDGTLKHRFKPLQGRLFMKTGLLANVHGLVGYGVAADGQILGVVVLVNGPDHPQTMNQLDGLISKIITLAY